MLSLSFLLLFMAQAQSPQKSCAEALRDTSIFCKVVDYACEDISKCLSRRNKCVTNGAPSSASDCLALNPCMEPFNRVTGEGSCVYQWDPLNNECSVQPRMFVNTKLCPGRRTGIMNVLLQGFEHFHDQNFDCRAVVGNYQKEKDKCQSEISKTLVVCSNNQLTAEFKKFQTTSCEHTEGLSFDDPLPSASIDDRARGEGRKDNDSTIESPAPSARGL